jgi:hypothetical protein
VEVNSKITDQSKTVSSIESVYKCLDCLVSGKTINFLILESCLHYENIHNMVLRYKLLGQICQEVLADYFPQRFRDKAPVFLERFILQNHGFFTEDQTIERWLDLLYSEVSFDPNDYGL